MTLFTRHAALCAVLFLWCFPVSGEVTEKGSPLPSVELSEEDLWLDLLHYHRAGLVSTYVSPLVSAVRSQIDDPDFFLSQNGAADPAAELAATMAAFEADHQSVASGAMDADSAAQCRFPARFHWLSTRLPDLARLAVKCPAFDDWSAQIAGKGLSIVFPAAFINSPSSMFGHTLIRIDREPGSNPLLAYAVNYAANANANDDPLLFSIKGLLGGYPGIVSIVPYYEKVKEYHFLESRNVWEYTLDVEQSEVDQFVRHVWEIRAARIDYFFLNENCSYQLLTLLDASSERFNFSDNFSVGVIPGDTVRVIADAGLVRETEFRASAATEMETLSAELDAEQLAAIRAFVEDAAGSAAAWAAEIEASGLAADDRELGLMLDTAYRYARFLAAKLKRSTPDLGRKSIQLLSQRSKLGDTGPVPASPVPRLRDDEGHDTQRIGMAAGFEAENPYLDVAIRSSFHDLLDPAGGYPEGASLEMFVLKARQAMGQDARLRVHELTFIDIDSRARRLPLNRPTSWSIAFGLDRESTYQPLSPYFDTSVGFSYGLGESRWLLTTSLAGSARAHDDIDKGYAVAAGPLLGLVRQSDRFSLHFSARQSFRVAGRSTDPSSLEAELAWHLTQALQLRVNSGYFDDSPADGWRGALSVFHAY